MNLLLRPRPGSGSNTIGEANTIYVRRKRKATAEAKPRLERIKPKIKDVPRPVKDAAAELRAIEAAAEQTRQRYKLAELMQAMADRLAAIEGALAETAKRMAEANAAAEMEQRHKEQIARIKARIAAAIEADDLEDLLLIMSLDE